MAKYAFIGAIVLGAAILISNNGCGGVQDRVGVVADKALKEIDKLIGNLDVQRKKVERQYKSVEQATRKVGEEHVRFEVKYKRALANQEKLTSDKTSVVKNLKTLKQLLGEAEESGAVTRNGREITKAELNTMATEQLQKLKNIDAQTKQGETTVALLQKNVDSLAKQKEVSRGQIAKLNGLIEKIDGQIEILKAQRVAESIVSPSKDINSGFDELQASVDKLSEDLEVQIAVTDEKLEQRLMELENSLDGPADIESIFEDKDEVSKTLSDIDKALMGE